MTHDHETGGSNPPPATNTERARLGGLTTYHRYGDAHYNAMRRKAKRSPHIGRPALPKSFEECLATQCGAPGGRKALRDLAAECGVALNEMPEYEAVAGRRVRKR